MSSVFITDGYFNYLGSNAGSDSDRTYFYNSSTDYDFYLALASPNSQSMGFYIDPFYGPGGAVSSSLGSTTFYGTSVVTLRADAVAAPEIDGSVLPRAAFVMMGLFWIFKSRQRRLRLAEA